MQHSFSAAGNSAFFSVLRKNVTNYFKTTSKYKHGNINMRIKSTVMFMLYFGPYVLLLSGIVTNPVLIVLSWVIIGFGMAGIGLSVMHDAIHRSYSSKPWVNRLMGYSMNLIGGNTEVWKLQHNRLHHTYTNVEGADDDINTPSFLRFSPHKKIRRIHRYQFLYVWFFYGISTLSWITTKEFIQLVKYRKAGLIESRKEFTQLMLQLIAWKLIYYSFILVLPLIFIPASPLLIIMSFLLMHFVTGLSISMVFQTAHVMPQCIFPKADQNGVINENWAVHEMLTTTNFAPRSRIFSWFIGGLNYQIEHHLFPSICHVHYRKISKIVQETAAEFGIPYNVEKNFLTALISHVKMLYALGRKEYQPALIKA